MAGAIEIRWHPGRRELRSFGFLALGAFGVLGALVLWRHSLLGVPLGSASQTVATVCFALGFGSGLLSIVAPRANRPLYLALVLATYPIGFVLSYVLMGLLFFGVITPIGLAMRMAGIDPLSRGRDPESRSYWDDHPKPRDRDRYFRQF
ncbi:MAG: SxtJ family membrane protein [Myxococcota bacterium]